MEVDEGAYEKSDILHHWIAAHAHLKNEFTEDEKYHNPMTWLIACSLKLFMCIWKSKQAVHFWRSRGPFLRCNQLVLGIREEGLS